MADVLLAYHGRHGHTRRICEAIAAELAAHGRQAEILPIEALAPAAPAGVDPARYPTIVLGAAIRNGRHDARVTQFVAAQRATLESRPSAFFSVNLVARKPEKNAPDTNPYVRNFLAASPWRPRLVGVFAGRLDYPRYGPLDRLVIRLIMWMTGGPTDPRTVHEYTDWNAVRAFATRVASLAAGREA